MILDRHAAHLRASVLHVSLCPGMEYTGLDLEKIFPVEASHGNFELYTDKSYSLTGCMFLERGKKEMAMGRCA